MKDGKPALTCYADESGLTERFLGYGAIVLPDVAVPPLETALNKFSARRGFGEREFSWKKCSPREVGRYCSFVDLFWVAWARVPVMQFRSMVVDTGKYPLRDPVWKCETEEDGFYRFYHFFLTRSVQAVVKSIGSCRIVVGALDDQYAFRRDVLTKTVAGQLRHHFGIGYEVVELEKGQPKASRVHQLSDVLLGAVTYRMNGRESHKEQICRRVEGHVGKALDRRFYAEERPFNVWHFTRRGDHRWARDSWGRV